MYTKSHVGIHLMLRLILPVFGFLCPFVPFLNWLLSWNA